MTAVPSASSASVTTKGGAKRRAVGVTPLTTRPRSRQARAISGAVRSPRASGVSSAASSRPCPLTRSTPPRAASPARSVSPLARATAGASMASMVSSTARAAARARGWPAKVEPWSPGPKAAATSGRAHTAPTGMPLPRALAMVTMSGAT